MSDRRSLRVLAPAVSLPVTRRGFLQGIAATGLLLAGCGAGSDSADDADPADSDSRSRADVGGTVRLFGWADYTDPALFERFADEVGATVTVDAYSSNEEAIARLDAAGGASGYDLLVPSGVYVPQMVDLGLLQPLDRTLLPNIANIDPAYTDPPWDPGNQYTVPKSSGFCGWLYDRDAVGGTISNWQEFITALQGPASGAVALLDTPVNLAGIYFWANGIDWTTEDPAELDACERFLIDEIAPHVRAFDSYAGSKVIDGNYVLAQSWNGDARFRLIDAPDRFAWGLGAPTTEVWVDTWAVVSNAPNTAAAHAWINFMLDPVNSVQDLQFHGYNTGVTGVRERAEAADTPLLDMVFLTGDQSATAVYGAVNGAQDRLVEIWNNVKAAASA